MEKNKKKKEKIAAVVVTYNRKELLQECLDSLLKQTRLPDSIIIMNNASTDGTEEMLKKKYLKNSIFDYVNLEENLGGAGGFHYGIKRAYKKGFDWIWCMDDDGIADIKELEILLKVSKAYELSMSGPLVLDKKNTNDLAFGLRNYQHLEEIKNIIIEDSLSPFNGTLIKSNLVGELGDIKKEMFIWGDEVEYMKRALKNKKSIGTVTSAIHYHPRTKTINEKILFFNLSVKPEDKCHIFIRNRGYLDKEYGTIINTIKFLISYTLYFIKKSNLKGIIKLYEYYFDGYFNKYKLPISLGNEK